jgi:ABC-type phosphate transport system substrate-binding protein
MRMRDKLLAGTAVLATVTALSAGTALADPPSGTNPQPNSVVSVGANTTQNLSDALSASWDKANPKKTQLYSWDALSKNGTDNNIDTKRGCLPIVRPNGSGPGIVALGDNIKDPVAKSNYCIDFARSSRARKSTDPAATTFVPLALDSVTYASVKGSNAPANLTTQDLTEIYTCTVTNWDKFPGGKNAPIKPLLAQSGSGTVSFFLTAIGVTAPGKCVSEPATLEENEGTNPVFTNKVAKDEIIPFSAGDWVAQAYHSAKCLKTSCTPTKGVTCKPTKSTNAFGCDLNGVLVLNNINGTAPVVSKALNPKFSAAFIRILYDVVRGSKIPAYLTQFLGTKGWYCKSTAAIKAYGFLPTSACGS